MDQVRTALAWMARHHFWLLCGLIVLTSSVTWYLSSSALAAELAKNRKLIKAEFDACSQVRAKPYHPNDTINRQQRLENVELANKVRRLWNELHDRQHDEVLKWPTQLGQDFINVVEDRPFGSAIPSDLRKVYQNYIERFYPELPKIVDAAEQEATGRRGGRSSRPTRRPGLGALMDGEVEEEESHLVLWEDQQNIREQLNLEETPSSLRIWVTQEDLWVYVTLLRAIAQVNVAADADRNANAAIREIYRLDVGKLAAVNNASQDRIYRAEVDNALNGPGGLLGGSLDDLDGGGFGNPAGFDDTGFGATGEVSEEQLLLAGRYLDAEGQRLPYTEGDFRFGTEFKRLPVHVELFMDQRWLPLLVTELSNAPLQVEVTELRVNPSDGQSGGRRARTRQRNGARSGEVLAFPAEPNVVPVSVRGTVTIFNPVDEEALDVGGGDEA